MKRDEGDHFVSKKFQHLYGFLSFLDVASSNKQGMEGKKQRGSSEKYSSSSFFAKHVFGVAVMYRKKTPWCFFFVIIRVNLVFKFACFN